MTTRKDERLRFLVALERSFLVWIRGLGLGIPIISLITEIVAYNHLLKFGQTSWDRDLHGTVIHGDLSAVRWFAIGAIWFVIVLVVFLVFLGLVVAAFSHL